MIVNSTECSIDGSLCEHFRQLVVRVLLLTAVKYIVVGFSMLPISFAALGTGLLFGSYNVAVAQNPEETENIFNTTLMGFALVETFVFLAFAVAALIFFV